MQQHNAGLRAWPILLVLTIVAVILSTSLWLYDMKQEQARKLRTAAAVLESEQQLRQGVLGITLVPTIQHFDQTGPGATETLSVDGTHTAWPLTDTVRVEVTAQYGGGYCANSEIASVTAELHAPGFDVDPLESEQRSYDILRASGCSLDLNPPVVRPFLWDLMPQTEGTHLLSLRIVGYNKKNQPIASDGFDGIVVVQPPPETFSSEVQVWSALTAVVLFIFALWDRFFPKKRTGSGETTG